MSLSPVKKALVVLVFCALFGVALSLGFDVDLHYKENRERHHTELYRGLKDDEEPSNDRLIVRRGDTFLLTVTPSGELPQSARVGLQLRPFDPIFDRPLRAPPIVIQQQYKLPCDGFCFAKVNGTLSVSVPPTAPIALYALDVLYFATNSSKTPTSTTTIDQRVVILFNPWCPQDDVYMEDEDALSEYILNEDGMTWVGNEDNFSPITWDFAQFSQAPLDVSLWLLQDLSNGKFEDRGDAVKIGRHLSAKMAVNNDGVLWGRWQTPYTGGKSPNYWDGSKEIFELFRKDQQGVKYGQCWVFAGILCTGGRTLGIPARPIVNFESAHESGKKGNYDLRIDTFFQANGSYISMEGSVWNFHQWTEFYMKRRDLPNADGWQTVDATPQELSSSGIYQLGPASLAAIHDRVLNDNFDVPFVVSEVDASLYKWIRKDTGKQPHPTYKGFWLMDIDDDYVGQRISTKAVGANRRQDVTSAYKADKPPTARNGKPTIRLGSEVSVRIVPPSKTTPIGKDISILVAAVCHVCNTTRRVLNVQSTISIVSQRGSSLHTLKGDMQNLTMTNNRMVTGYILISREQYQMFLGDYQGFQYSTTAVVYSESAPNVFDVQGDIVNKFGQFSLASPSPILEAAPLSVNNATGFVLNVSFVNPISIPLTGVVIKVSGSGVSDMQIPHPDVAADSTLASQLVVAFRPYATDPTVVTVKILCNEISAVQGFLSVPHPTSTRKRRAF